MKQTIKTFFKRIIDSPGTVHQRACAVAVGAGLAVSPLLGVQTWFIFLFGWLFHLSIPIMFSVVYLINNPWTMIPIAAFDYWIGFFIMERLWGVSLLDYNPSFMEWVNRKIGVYIMRYLGIPKLCFWYYIGGGFLVSLVVGALCYPLSKKLFQWYESRHEGNNSEQKSVS